LPPSGEVAPTQRSVDAGVLSAASGPAGEEATAMAPVPVTAGEWMAWEPLAPRHVLVLWNAGTEPAVILELAIAPVGPEAVTPVAATTTG
jgi:hypothetical protein